VAKKSSISAFDQLRAAEDAAATANSTLIAARTAVEDHIIACVAAEIRGHQIATWPEHKIDSWIESIRRLSAEVGDSDSVDTVVAIGTNVRAVSRSALVSNGLRPQGRSRWVGRCSPAQISALRAQFGSEKVCVATADPQNLRSAADRPGPGPSNDPRTMEQAPVSACEDGTVPE
jgi:hypothetical protein